MSSLSSMRNVKNGPAAKSSENRFQTDALSSASDWLISKRPVAIWKLAWPQCRHQVTIFMAIFIIVTKRVKWIASVGYFLISGPHFG